MLNAYGSAHFFLGVVDNSIAFYIKCGIMNGQNCMNKFHL
jgi:hypothetical protein